MLKALLAFTCLTLSIGAATSQAATIYSGSLKGNVANSSDGTSIGALKIGDIGGSGTGDGLFTEALSTSVVGTTFTYNTGVEFDMAVDLLTNGFDDGVFGYVALGGGGGDFESTFFSSVSLNGIDLAGFSIDSLQWTIDSFEYNSGLGNVTLRSSLTVNGQSVVPIPAAAWLFGSALLGLGVVKRKKA
jgi:hypothetical protein